jgi:hypothetical protein
MCSSLALALALALARSVLSFPRSVKFQMINDRRSDIAGSPTQHALAIFVGHVKVGRGGGC